MKESVVLFGASGTMGSVAFHELWKRRDRYDIILLVRPSKKNKRLFQPYEKLAGATSIPGAGVVEGEGFRIVWGDATHYEQVQQAVRGADWVLDAMALISPEADYYPEKARAVNTDRTVNIVRAIEAQPGGIGSERAAFGAGRPSVLAEYSHPPGFRPDRTPNGSARDRHKAENPVVLLSSFLYIAGTAQLFS